MGVKIKMDQFKQLLLAVDIGQIVLKDYEKIKLAGVVFFLDFYSVSASYGEGVDKKFWKVNLPVLYSVLLKKSCTETQNSLSRSLLMYLMYKAAGFLKESTQPYHTLDPHGGKLVEFLEGTQGVVGKGVQVGYDLGKDEIDFLKESTIDGTIVIPTHQKIDNPKYVLKVENGGSVPDNKYSKEISFGKTVKIDPITENDLQYLKEDPPVVQKLSKATKIFQKTFGTSLASTYLCIGLGQNINLSYRKTDSTLSLRVENKTATTTLVENILNSIGFINNTGHRSFHVNIENKEDSKRVIGSVLYSLGSHLDQVATPQEIEKAFNHG